VIAAEETGTEFQPYGGRYYLFRTGPNGPVRLDVDFSNTPASQRLTITRTPAAKGSIVPSANGAAAAPAPAAPAGA